MTTCSSGRNGAFAAAPLPPLSKYHIFFVDFVVPIHTHMLCLCVSSAYSAILPCTMRRREAASFLTTYVQTSCVAFRLSVFTSHIPPQNACHTQSEIWEAISFCDTSWEYNISELVLIWAVAVHCSISYT